MASEDELRKVAEDLRALARSLARDFRRASEEARWAGYPPDDAFRHGVRAAVGRTRTYRRADWPPRGRVWRGYPYWWEQPYRPGPTATGPLPPPPPPSAPPTATRPPGARTAQPGEGHRSRPGPCDGPFGPSHHARARRRDAPPVRRHWDGSAIAGLLVVLFGVAWLLGASGLLRIPAEAVAALGLMLLGGGMIITARTDWSLSRRSWPLWVGLLLVAVLVATSGALTSPGDFGPLSSVFVHHSAAPPGGVGGGALSGNAPLLVSSGGGA